MKIGAIIQSRLGSSRYPKKSLATINGISVLEHVVNRVYMAVSVDKIIIACPESPQVCLNEEIFIGSETDVLDRYYQCAKKYNLDIIVRITADCPILMPSEIDRCVRYLVKHNTHYVTNCPAMPDGFDVEAFTFKSLEDAWNQAKLPYDREHVTPWIKQNKGYNPIALDAPKLSLDTEADMKTIKEWYELERKIYIGDRGYRFVCDPLHQTSTYQSQA